MDGNDYYYEFQIKENENFIEEYDNEKYSNDKQELKYFQIQGLLRDVMDNEREKRREIIDLN